MTVEVFGLAPVVFEAAELAGVFDGVFVGVFAEDVVKPEAGFSAAVPSLPTCGVAGGVWLR